MFWCAFYGVIVGGFEVFVCVFFFLKCYKCFFIQCFLDMFRAILNGAVLRFSEFPTFF